METQRQAALERVAKAARVVAEDPDFPGLQDLVVALQNLDGAKQDCCVAKYPGEPTFTLVGRDKLSTKTLSHWLYLAEQAGVTEPGPRMNRDKFDDAVSVLETFREWQRQNPDKVKLPD